MTSALASALLLVFAPLPLLSEFHPQEIHNQADGEASHPVCENLGKPNVNESSHCEQPTSCERFVPQGGSRFSHRGHSCFRPGAARVRTTPETSILGQLVGRGHKTSRAASMNTTRLCMAPVFPSGRKVLMHYGILYRRPDHLTLTTAQGNGQGANLSNSKQRMRLLRVAGGRHNAERAE